MNRWTISGLYTSSAARTNARNTPTCADILTFQTAYPMFYSARHHKRISLGSIICLCLGSVLSTSAQRVRDGELSARQTAKQTFPSVVVLIAEDRSGDSYLGSGFFVDTDVVATNYHVIKDSTKIMARRVGQKRVYSVSLLSFDDDRDLAILRVEGAIARSLPLAKTSKVGVGDVVYVAGNPEGLEGTFSQGIVSALRGTDYVQITAPISQGSSGGPVLNSRGEVIGVAVGTIKEGQNLNFAVQVSRLLPLVARSTILRRSPNSERPPDRPSNRNGRGNAAATSVDEASPLLSRQRYAEAAEAFKTALRQNADDTRALLGLGSAYEGLRKYQEAIDVYNDLIRTRPEMEDGYESLAMVLFKLERYDQAVEVYKRAMKVIPKSISGYTGAASVLEFQCKMAEIEGSNIESLLQEAEAILNTAVQQSDDPSSAYDHWGDLYCDYLKRCSEALIYYKLAIEKVDQTNPITAPVELGSLHYKLGKTYLILGDRSSAIKEYRLLKSLKAGEAEQLFNEIYK